MYCNGRKLHQTALHVLEYDDFMEYCRCEQQFRETIQISTFEAGGYDAPSVKLKSSRRRD